MDEPSKQDIITGNTSEETPKGKEKESTEEVSILAPASIESPSTVTDPVMILAMILATVQDDLSRARPLLKSLSFRQYQGGLVIYIKADLEIGFHEGRITLAGKDVTVL